jgi:hypothetical protein
MEFETSYRAVVRDVLPKWHCYLEAHQFHRHGFLGQQDAVAGHLQTAQRGRAGFRCRCMSGIELCSCFVHYRISPL